MLWYIGCNFMVYKSGIRSAFIFKILKMIQSQNKVLKYKKSLNEGKKITLSLMWNLNNSEVNKLKLIPISNAFY